MTFSPVDLEKSYKALKIKKGATLDEIKSAYRKLARRYHPDLNPKNRRAEARFKEITEAYQILNNHHRKDDEQTGQSQIEERGTSINQIVNNIAKSIGGIFKN
ncbi:MAG: J domain-containing protein [Prochloraceae cyanobacterium]|nr:J domain-containing protein [Prochloraceae cyanobacterium]